MAAVSGLTESPAGAATGPGGTRPPRRSSRLSRWVRKPSTAVALLGVAVVVGVVQGQPPPAARDSGRSVPAVQSYPRSVGQLLVVVDGRLLRFDTLTKKPTRVPLPRGFTALRAWNQIGRYVVLGRLAPTNRTVVYALSGRTAVPLGAAEVAVPSADGRAVWIAAHGVATRVPLAGGQRRSTRLPPKSRLVADTPYGLIVSTGTVPDPPLAPDRVETPTPTPTAPTASTPAPTGTVPADAGRTPRTTRSPVTATPSPTTPPYTTASPVPSSGPNGVPLTTLVVGYDGRTRFLAAAEALAAAGDTVLLRDEVRRLGVISPRPGAADEPRLLPSLAAIQVVGPGTLDARGHTFAVLGRTNDYAWMLVGPTSATTNGAINVVALEGGPPVLTGPPPSFTASGRVLTVRPDGRIVYYRPGDTDGFTIAGELPPATDVDQA
jgi:hypothetical protein